MFRLVTGCSWDVAGRLGKGSETTLRRRRDEWVACGAFGRLVEEAIRAFDKVIGLDLSEVSIDGSLHKAPAGGEGTGPNPTDRGKTGWKWSLATDANGIPIGWMTDGANRNDCVMLPSTLDAVAAARSARRPRDPAPRPGLRQRRRPVRMRPPEVSRTWSSPNGARRAPPTSPSGSPSGSAGRSSGRTHGFPTSVSSDATPTVSSPHRLAQIALAVTLIITVKLVKWAARWNA